MTQIIKINTDIPGWMSETDLGLLAAAATVHQPGTILVEIGSFCGRSSWTLSQNLPAGSQLHCVDTWALSTMYSPFTMKSACYVSEQQKTAVFDLARQHNDWLPAFKFCTRDCSNITAFKMSSDQYTVDQNNTSMVFIDGGHSFEEADRDISKFDFSDEVLLFGDDFVSDYPGVIKSVFKNQKPRNRILIKPPATKIWFLWPIKGYYAEQLNNFYSSLNQIYNKKC